MTTHVPTELEVLSEPEISTAEELVGRFPLTLNESSASQADYEQVMPEFTFSNGFTNHMTHMRWTKEEGWSGRGIIPYGPFALTSGAAVLHYSQSAFKDIKAYRHAGGSIWTFHPVYDAVCLNHSVSRLALPKVDRGDFLVSLVGYVRADEKWVPTEDGTSLYLRPPLFAPEEFLDVHASSVVNYYVTDSPSGPYFIFGLTGVVIQVVKGYHRTGSGSMGSAKCGGNYVASLMPQLRTAEEGFSQVCFLDTYEEKHLKELGGTNMFVVMANGTACTPELIGVVPEGGIRSATCKMLCSQGTLVREEMIALDKLVAGIRSDEVMEVFTRSTAAVATLTARSANDDFDVELPVGETAKRVHEQLTDTQIDYAQDPFRWVYRSV